MTEFSTYFMESSLCKTVNPPPQAAAGKKNNTKSANFAE